MITNLINDFLEKFFIIIQEDKNKKLVENNFVEPITNKIIDIILPYIIILLVLFITLLIFMIIICFLILKKKK